MFGTMGDPPKRAGSFLPPATTRRLPERPVTSTREARIAPPYIPSAAPPPQPEAELPLLAAAHFEPVEPLPPEEPEPLTTSSEEPVTLETTSEPDPWDAPDEGEVEPAFSADSEALLEQLMAEGDAQPGREEFPLDAFIVPEQAQHVPTGLEGAPATPPPPPTATSALAERLEKLSHRLRVEESDAIVRRLAAGDRLDALLAGLLAGYLAGKSEQQ